jgi:hypothetical protein
MAATWTYKIEVTNLPDKIANVTATRTDASVTPPDVRTYMMPLVEFVQAGKTAAQIRAEIVEVMFAKWTADKERSALVAVVTAQETLLAAATNAKET